MEKLIDKKGIMRFKTLKTVKVFSDGSFCFLKDNYFSKNSFNFFLKTQLQNINSFKKNEIVSTKNGGLKFSYRNKILIN